MIFDCLLCELPRVVWQERPLLHSPWDLEEGFDWMHLSQRGVAICKLDGCDAKRPHVTTGVVRGVVLLLAGYDLATQHNLNYSFRLSQSPLAIYSSNNKRGKEVRLLNLLNPFMPSFSNETLKCIYLYLSLISSSLIYS